MTTWVLILFVGVGMAGDGEANALTSVPGFASEELCSKAGTASVRKFESGTKRVQYVCTSQGAKQ